MLAPRLASVAHWATCFYSVLLSACISFIAASEIDLHFLILLFSFAEGKIFLLSLLCSVVVSLPFTVFLPNATVFLVVSPLSYEVLYGTVILSSPGLGHYHNHIPVGIALNMLFSAFFQSTSIKTKFLQYQGVIECIKKLMKKNKLMNKLDKNITGPIFPKIVQSILKQKKGSQNIYKILNKNNDEPSGKKNGAVYTLLTKSHGNILGQKRNAAYKD